MLSKMLWYVLTTHSCILLHVKDINYLFHVCVVRRGPVPPEQIIVAPNTPAMSTMASQLTEDNEDFAERGRYHQSEIVQGENFDDYAD